ncbi:uncharacterized protein LOC143222619 isoform X3 [Tachypleus tridentatus]|uniref:uncharacterized protein LOC143222619 isoform X3 n=1 Tax=Tachypleus tridentatus TaxID=6853 RepID=UPI003FCF961A
MSFLVSYVHWFIKTWGRFLFWFYFYASATNKSIGEAIQVKPINVSMTTKTGREETLAAAGPIKTSPQYFIPFKFAYISLKLGTDWSEFCTGKEFIRKEIADLISKKGVSVEFNQIVFFDILGDCRAVFDKKNNFTTFRDGEGRFIQISLFLLNKNGHYDFNLTETCGALLKSGANDVKNTIYDRKVYSIQVEFRTKDERPYTKPLSPGNRRVITVMSVAGVCVLAVILAIIRHRHKRTSKCEQRHQEDNSLDCFHTVTNNQQKEFQFSARSFFNQAFDELDMLSHSVDSTVLTSFSCNYEAMEDEFKSIPMSMSRMDQIPSGAEIKNRYANVIPNPKTRVPLSYIRGEANSNYINANFVRGYGGKPDFYIACQAPLPETVADFWRMIWEQQCKVILMLTQWDEGDIPQCAPYFSENTVKCHRVFGDFQVSLHKRQVEEHYTISIFRLYNLQRNLFREITHLWYRTWAAHGVPEDVNIMLQYLLEARRYMNNNTGPVVVHCSSGTGRTGIVLALDICMREFEECRTVDILRCVSRLRQDRDGAVQTKEQYFFLYEALNEYSCRFVNRSRGSSIMVYNV